MFGAPLEQAYEIKDIQVKKSKKKKNKQVVFDDELKPIVNQTNLGNASNENKPNYNKLDNIQDNLNDIQNNIMFNNYSPYHVNDNNGNNANIGNNGNNANIGNNEKILITRGEYEKLKNNSNNSNNNLSNNIIENFTTDDEFNEVLLFSLSGMFFLFILDFVYKMGKK